MNRKTQIFYFSVLSFLSPFLATYFTFRSITWSVRKPILILIITLFGSTIILHTSDGADFMQMIQDHYMDLTFRQWLFELKQTLLFSPVEGTKGDVFFHVFAYIFGSVIGLPQFYFTFISFIYAWFFISSLSRILVWDSRIKKNALFWALIIVFVSYRFIDNLQTVRTWTGLWALFYGTYRYHETKKIKYLFLMLTAPLFHVAYFLMALPAYAVVFIKKVNPKFYIIAYILSFVLNVNPAGIVEKLQSTDIGEDKVAGYYRENPEDYDTELNNRGNFYVSLCLSDDDCVVIDMWDDGVGVNDDDLILNPNTLGFVLIGHLTQQLNGDLTILGDVSGLGLELKFRK